MKKVMVLFLACINFAFAKNFSGSYDCSGYDTKDGAYSNDVVTLTEVKEHSFPDRDLYAYQFVLHDEKGKLLYSGEAASNGNSLAIYFANVDKKSKSDHGVGIATVGDIISRDSSGNFVHKFNFNKFYYEPQYPSDGSETCIQRTD